MTEIKEVWVFNGVNAKFPSAVFLVKEDAFGWIKKHALTGVLTKYPVGISVYEWAIESGNFKVKSEKDSTPEFIGKFSSAAQEHMHFENGIFD
ncbi:MULTISPECIES: hypothetical protein [Variovorax]|jgi:hypothetical protein|uniref:DUF7710 domain-containing protein n=1 Tax=Variovorax TaxID=34072 RepID=UPI0008CA34A6|nr:hypothetical protein [Variovorax sp. OV084]SEU17929.1 hypothetical protein SAMN05443580_12244 [Variovorax sp. OV084]